MVGWWSVVVICNLYFVISKWQIARSTNFSFFTLHFSFTAENRSPLRGFS